MKYLRTLAFSALTFLPLTRFSQVNVMSFNSACGTLIEFADTMTKYGEFPLARGTSNRSLDGVPDRILVVFLNPETRSWTMAEQVTDEVVCIVALGQGFKPLDEDGNSLGSGPVPNKGI